ncbi:MAG: hypothetical protein MI739_14425 [Bacteroidales bacterium]|nr:hypothetical protein [Bacteroidales bacterium]
MKYLRSNIFSYLFFAITMCIAGSIVLNNILYTHIHKLNNGQVIVHSHPYNKSQENKPEATHQHTDSELFVLQSLALLISYITVSISFYSTVKILSRLFKFLNLYLSENLRIIKERAPPTFYILEK